MKLLIVTALCALCALCAGGFATAAAASNAAGASAAAPVAAVAVAAAEAARWRRRALNVRIVRDPWGIAHIYGKSDADTVFGTLYAQAEDDFGRIERNYLTGLGMLAQADGESAIYSDLRQRLFVDPARLQQQFRASAALKPPRGLPEEYSQPFPPSIKNHPSGQNIFCPQLPASSGCSALPLLQSMPTHG